MRTDTPHFGVRTITLPDATRNYQNNTTFEDIPECINYLAGPAPGLTLEKKVLLAQITIPSKKGVFLIPYICFFWV